MRKINNHISSRNSSISGLYTIPQEKRTILLVDDDPTCMEILTEYVKDLGYRWACAYNYKDALNILKKNNDIVLALLDINLPDKYGSYLISEIKNDDYLNNIFVVTQTADISCATRNRAIDAGVFYHLTKPYSDTQIINVINSAIEQYEERRKLFSRLFANDTTPISTIPNISPNNIHYDYEFKTLSDIEDITQSIAKIYPDKERVLIGIHELLVNAVEHGNLGITFDEKSELIADNCWTEEIEKRLKYDHYKDRIAQASCKIMKDYILLTIKDMGDGFDYNKYMNLDISKLSTANGRGIAIARISSFDHIEYSENGTKVECYYNL